MSERRVVSRRPSRSELVSGRAFGGRPAVPSRPGIFAFPRDRKATGQYTPVVESGPVFADASGRRRRFMLYAGFGAAAALAVCLGAVVVAMAGGPRAPFTQWAGPQPPVSASAGHSSRSGAGGPAAAQNPAGGTAGAATPAAGGPPSATASPSAGASPTAARSASASTSPAPTNPAGKTPPGLTKSPNPHKSASVA